MYTEQQAHHGQAQLLEINIVGIKLALGVEVGQPREQQGRTQRQSQGKQPQVLAAGVAIHLAIGVKMGGNLRGQFRPHTSEVHRRNYHCHEG